ncbi:MAG: MFS transporter [Betaproteobacteria bacterium]|nr:MFS transporter [Betaproteobacteria bacterium]
MSEAGQAQTTGRSRYGWAIVPLAALVMLATLPGRTHGLGLITEPFLADLKLDRVAFANINLWATLLGAAFCLPAGWALDRYGVRRVTVALLLATGASAWALGLASGAFLPLLLLVTLTRGFGQSALSVCSITAVGKWFGRRPGPAMGMYAFLMGLFFSVAFGVVGWAVREHGWRVAWSGVAMVLTFLFAPLMLLLLRDAPKEPEANDAGAQAASGMTLNEAVRTPVFWVFAGGTALYGLVSSGLGLFQQAVLAERGFDQKTYHTLLVGTTLVSLVAQLATGWLSTRVTIGRLTGVALLLHAVGLGWLPFIKQLGQLWTFAALMGISGRIIIVVFFAVWSQAFGRAHLGRIQASAQMVTVLASAVGPLLFAKCHALAGSYAPVLFVLAPVGFMFAAAAWCVKLPHQDNQFSTP